MKKPGSKAFKQTVRNLKGKGAWAIRPDGTPLIIGTKKSIRSPFAAYYTIKFNKKNKNEISSI